MRIFLIVLTLVFALNTSVFAQDHIKFIYVHGTNDNNYKKKVEFKKGVNKIHPYMVKEFNKSEYVKRYLLEDGKYTISERPVAFYWGDQSKNDLNLLSDWLDVTKFFSPKLAQSVRSMLAHTLHDAIWIQKYNNMKPVVDKLHQLTSFAVQNGDKYVLLGHSAGSFITVEYMLYKTPMVNTREFLIRRGVPRAKMQEIAKIGYRDTCLDALIDSKIAIFKRDNTFIIQQDNLIENYKKLPEIEKTSCTNIDNIAGIINFGSPLTLFYSGFADASDSSLVASLGKSLINNNFFVLNINFAEDPLGFPVFNEDDYTALAHYKNMVDLKMRADKKVSDNKEQPVAWHDREKYGFVYDKSNIRSNTFVAKSHTSYWKKRKFFSKSVVKAYNEGISMFLNSVILDP